MPQREVVAYFFVPITEDSTIGNGELHPPFRWKFLQDAFFEAFEGLTVYPGELAGIWKDSKTQKAVHDKSRKFEIHLEKRQLPKLRALLRQVALTFVQQTICAVIDGKPEYQTPEANDEPLL